MLKNIAFACVTMATVGLAGCGGGDDTSAPAVDMTMQVFKVVSGTYTISNLTKVSDACALALEKPAAFTSIQVANSGPPTGHLPLGAKCLSTGNPPTCNPPVYQN